MEPGEGDLQGVLHLIRGYLTTDRIWAQMLSWVEVDLAALRHNYCQIRARLAPGTSIMGIVKSDAYGHGMIPVARELVLSGIDFLGVSKFWEALELRECGLRVPILTLLGLEPPEMEDALRQAVRPLIFRLDHARLLSRAACRLGVSAPVHLKLDTGMGRLGVPLDALWPFLDELLSLPGIQLEGIVSHLASADEADESYTRRQVGLLVDVLQRMEAGGRCVPYVHIANSAAILALPACHFHMVRPGIALYGCVPNEKPADPPDLAPVMQFKSRILQIKQVPAGQCIGYGRTFTTACPTRVATIPVGYDDGYSRLLSNRGQVLIAGRRAPVIGTVSMCMITVDVSHIPQAREDDEAVLLGTQQGERITAEEVGRSCGTISYEMLCRIGRHRFKRFLNASETGAQWADRVR